MAGQRPWRVMVGTDKVRSYSTKETALGVAVTKVYMRQIGIGGFIEHATTRERISITHEPSHIVRVRFHRGHGE